MLGLCFLFDNCGLLYKFGYICQKSYINKKDMKTLRAALRFSTLLKATTSTLKNMPKIKFNTATLTVSGLTTGSAFLYATQKVMAEEVVSY